MVHKKIRPMRMRAQTLCPACRGLMITDQIGTSCVTCSFKEFNNDTRRNIKNLLSAIFRSRRDKKQWLDTPNRDLKGLSPKTCLEFGMDEEVLSVLKSQLGNVARNS